MGRKGGGHTAVGYWGRNPHCRIKQEQTGDKIKVLLQDKLIAMGRPTELWLPVKETTPGTVPCTCDKDTRPASDFRCLSCYGTRKVPGYLRFLHETIFAASAEYASLTLVSVERDLDIKPNRLRLTSTATTGTITTPDKPFANPQDEDWTFEVAAFNKTVTDVITVEFSTDAGGTWTNIVDLNGANKPTGSGNIRFRITLTRAATTTDSPDFEILRIRHRQPDRQTTQSKVRKDLEAGQVLMLRTWVIERVLRQMALGRQIDFQADKAWTAPLDFFDKLITADTPDAKISDREAGPHPFYEHAVGIDQGERFPIYQVSYNENLGAEPTFTHQAFFDRRAQDGEMYHLVF
jgi:hypothetical protein